ncbi:AbrB/MazE/SpoVT family DNA-binding domain-containing protein [Ferroplasma acidiphilum]|uniref:AbrB/MazE/SpoVT family DNA-binding domain-containing protein n=1 Tax=Ferroplasma acidiphilum TaxID=74969 RepID=UPI0009C0F754
MNKYYTHNYYGDKNEDRAEGQILIPKEIRTITGIKENTEVIVSLNDDCIVIKKSKPATESYFTYYAATYSKKLKNNIDINKILDRECDRDFLH